MADASTDLLGELRSLRRGRGVHAPHLAAALGARLRAVCGVVDGDDPAAVRRKVIDRLDELSRMLPADLRVAAAAALGLRPETDHAFLSQRIQWLAEHLDREERTARRRVDSALIALAEAAARRGHPAAQACAPDGCYVEKLSSVVLLDRETPRAIERRRIVALRDGTDRITAAISLPRDPADRPGSHDLIAEVLYGGTLVAKNHRTESEFAFELRFPRPLAAGDRHEYAIDFRLPAGQRMRTHYVYTSPRRCDIFDLRVRFADRQPELAWSVPGVFNRALDDGQPCGELLSPDGAGEIRVLFRELTPGYCYGLQWRLP